MADAYRLFENRDVFKYTNWFVLVRTTSLFRLTGQYVHKKRGFGIIYDMLDRSFRDNDLLDEVTTAKTRPWV
jgi:hypothetical protein